MPKSARKTQISRPDMPAGYGLTPLTSPQDRIPWEQVEDQLREKRNYWVSSTRPNARPHAMPVWGVWLDGAVYFSTDPQSRKGRNLAANPEVVIHLESGDDVVILEGRVETVTDRAVLQQADQAYFAKYQFNLVGDLAAPGLVYRLRPRYRPSPGSKPRLPPPPPVGNSYTKQTTDLLQRQGRSISFV